MNLNPTTWTVKAHVLTWLPVAAFLLALFGRDQVAAVGVSLNPFVTKASFAKIEQQVDVLLIFRLQDEIDALTLKRDRLQRLIERSDDEADKREWRSDLRDVSRKLGAFGAQLNEACDTPQLRLFC